MKRSPAAAFWLSLLPGLGHVYLGLTAKGAVFALLTVGLVDAVDRGADAFGILIPIYWVFVMLDAHRSAQAINRGAVSGDSFTGAGAKWWGGVLIGLGVLFLLSNLGLFDFDWLWRFWPAALIVLGIKLLLAPPKAPAALLSPEPESPPPEVPVALGDDVGPASSSGSSGEGEPHGRPDAG